MIKKISVDEEKCIHCGLCIEDCVMGIIAFDAQEIPQFTADGAEKCCSCQHCMAVCPSGALSIGGKRPQDSSAVCHGNSEDLLQLIKSRRSVRFYRNESVPSDILDKLVAMLPFVPTGGNADNLHFSIIATKEKMEHIRKTTYDTILALPKPTAIQQRAKESFLTGKDAIYRRAPSMIVVAIDKSKTIPGCETADPIIALSYFELYAQSLGLGTVWCDYAVLVAKQTPEVYSLLEIPANYELDYIMMFGIPNIKYSRTIQPEMFNVHLLH